ncbi:CBM96 family carbohydrate-binding protein [Pontiella desulfatans]|nr:DNRLRE domain-containing protein [Pontiella desulfatans]
MKRTVMGLIMGLAGVVYAATTNPYVTEPASIGLCVWNEGFDYALRNPHLNVRTAGGEVIQTNGTLRMNTEAGSEFSRAMVVATEGQTGRTMLDGHSVYDYSAHTVSTRFDFHSGNMTNEIGSFQVHMGELAISADDAGRYTGFAVELDKVVSNDAWRIRLGEYHEGSLVGAYTGLDLAGKADAFGFDVLGTNLTLWVEGTTFVAGGTDASWNLSGTHTPASYGLAFGARAETAADVTEVVLDSFEVTAPFIPGVPDSYVFRVGPSRSARLEGDIDELFVSPKVDQWTTVASQINFFNRSSPTMVSSNSAAATANWANQANVLIGFGGGIFRPTMNSAALSPSMDLARENLKPIDAVVESGGVVTSFVFDGPIRKLLMDLETGLTLKDAYGGLTLEESISRMVECWQGIHARYPELEIGIGPNFLAWDWDDNGSVLYSPANNRYTDRSGYTYDVILDRLYAALAAVGETIAFVQPETGWHFYVRTESPDGYPVDNDLRFLKLKEWCDARDIKFSVLLGAWDSSAAPAEAAQYFYDGTMAYITRMHDIGIYPDGFSLSSWWEDPELHVPETTSNTFMNTARDAMALTHSLYDGEYGIGGTGQAVNPVIPVAAQAASPAPAHAATGQSLTTTLSWICDGNTVRSDVYFGTNSAALEYQGWFTTPTVFDPGILQPDTTYYWRVDVHNSSGTTTGLAWSFSTSSENNLMVQELDIEADTYVRSAVNKQDTSFHTRETLAVCTLGTPATPNSFEAYVKVLVPSDIRFPVRSARLRLYAYNPVADDMVSIYPVADTNWTGPDVTWNTKPAKGALIASEISDTGTGWFEFDLSDQITGPGYYAFALDSEVAEVTSMFSMNHADSSLWPALFLEGFTDQIGNITLSGNAGGDLLFSWDTAPGQSYTMLTNADLTSTGWGILETMIGEGGTVTVTNHPDQIRLFYKVETP